MRGERFSRLRFPHIDDAIWLTCSLAQALIIYAVKSVLAAVRYTLNVMVRAMIVLPWLLEPCDRVLQDFPCAPPPRRM